MRGNQSTDPPQRGQERSIPACAGEPGRQHLGTILTGVRGNHDRQLLPLHRVGSIPACAGEPLRGPTGPRPGEVYPRVCGGTDRVVVTVGASSGLSPRVRGNRPRRAQDKTELGSIPACAGEPRKYVASDTSDRVYPRVCGGTPSGDYDSLTFP